jgi:hypothetical protein
MYCISHQIHEESRNIEWHPSEYCQSCKSRHYGDVGLPSSVDSGEVIEMTLAFSSADLF